MKLAAVSSKSIVGNVQQNLFTTMRWIKKLDKQGADFILFPELNLSGYTQNTEILHTVCAEKEIIYQQLLQLSEQVKAAFAVGFPEKSASNYYISHLLFFQGKLIGIHRKTHLAPREKGAFAVGTQIRVFAAGELKIGMQLCYETHFPELSYAQAKQGANVLAMAFASPHESSKMKGERMKRFLPARAYDNACMLVACNQHGETESGKVLPPLALVIDAKGEVLNERTRGSCIAEPTIGQIDKIQQSEMACFNKYKQTHLFRSFYAKEVIMDEEQ